MCQNCDHSKKPRRPGPRVRGWRDGIKAATHNFFTSADPLPLKLLKVPINVYRRGVQLSSCCGNYGEPGC